MVVVPRLADSMPDTRYDLIGVGLYAIPEAAHLTGVSAARIRRWVKGYSRHYGQMVRNISPVWAADLPEVDGKMALTFLDLMEVRFVNAFLAEGVSWKSLRRVVDEARQLLDTAHPFATRRFVTDGRTIFAEIGRKTRSTKLLDLTRNRFAFGRIISPSLKLGLEFAPDNRTVARWWPLGERKFVVLDPQRSFGRPIVHQGSVPTSILAAAVEAEDDENNAVPRVAKWYGVAPRAVAAAVEYELRLAA